MKLEWMGLCRDGFLKPEVTIAGLGVDGIIVPEIPRDVAITVVIQVSIPWKELTDRVEMGDLTIAVIDPEMHPVWSQTLKLEVKQVNPLHPDGWDGINFTVLALGFTAQTEGTYTISAGLVSGGSAPKSLPLNIKVVGRLDA